MFKEKNSYTYFNFILHLAKLEWREKWWKTRGKNQSFFTLFFTPIFDPIFSLKNTLKTDLKNGVVFTLEKRGQFWPLSYLFLYLVKTP